MTRPKNNRKKPQVLEDDDSEFEQHEKSPTDVGDLPTASTPAITSRESDEPSEAQLERFRRTWRFQPLIDALEKDTSKPKTTKAKDYFTKYFENVAIFRARTFMLFERWADLTNNNSRDGQMKDLLGLLHGRWYGHRGKGISIGNDRETKDENLRADLLKLLKHWYPYEDFGEDPVEAGDEEEEDAEETEVAQPGETPATEHPFELSQRISPRQQSLESTSTRNGTDRASRSRSGARAHRRSEERAALEQTILDNWEDHAATVPEHLPDHLGPAGVYWTDWPFSTLEALVDLSSVTRSKGKKYVYAKLKELASDTEIYSHAQSLDIINAARKYFDKGKGVHLQPDPQNDNPERTIPHCAEKRPPSKPPSGQRPRKQTKPATPTDNLSQPRDTTIVQVPPGLSTSDKLRYRDLSFEIMDKDSQRREAERQVEGAMAERSSVCLNGGIRAFAAAEVDLCDRWIEVERLRGEMIELQARRWEIVGAVGGDALEEVWGLSGEGVRKRDA